MKNILFLCDDNGMFDNFNKFNIPHSKDSKKIVTDEILSFIESRDIDTLICNAKQIKVASRLLWTSNCLKRYILTDTDNPLLIEESNKKVETKMWDIIAVRSGNDPIEQAGWISSYTNEKFTQTEMKEWVNNAVCKLKPYLFENASILEIGIASGLTCCEIAPYVRNYIGIDISKETLIKTKEFLAQKNIGNVSLIVADAIDIGQLDISSQDIIIINSVAQYFAGYNYFIAMLKNLLGCMKNRSLIFLGDILDAELKSTFEDELIRNGIKRKNVSDLYYPKSFMKELPVYIPEIVDVQITGKFGTIENEMKKYRYDVILTVDKNNKKTNVKRSKFQYALLARNFSVENILKNESTFNE